MRLEGKTALVTGGTTGIGLATAKQFLDEGADVIITGQNEERLKAAADDLAKDHGGKVGSVRWRAEEVADSASVATFIKDRSGHLDIVFANAGVTWPAPFGEIDPEEMQRQFMVNVTGPLNLLQAVTPLMGEGGSIILNTSCLDVLGMPGMAVYSASKAAFRSLARTLAVELKDRDIRVNSVAPGPVETPIYDKLGMPPEDLKQMADGLAGTVPAGRFAKPEEIAGVVTFLASDASSFLFAEEINADGGWANV